MKAMAVIGGTGRGKTTFIKNEILSRVNSHIIYDVNNEYYKNSFHLPEIEEFIDRIEDIRNVTFVFEEATIFFKHSQGVSRKVENLLVRKRHKQQFFVFVFHALHQIPVSIIDYLDTYVLFKTDENINLVENKFRGHERIINNYREVLKSDNFHFYKVF